MSVKIPAGVIRRKYCVMKKVVAILLVLILCSMSLVSCGIGENVAKPKEFVIGEELLLNDGEEFSIPIADTDEWCTGVTAKLVAVEEIPLDNPDAWSNKNDYLDSYKYRLYVSGYCPIKNAGKECTYRLSVRFSPHLGSSYIAQDNYRSTTIGEDGYFEFSTDLYLPDAVTKVIPTRMYT